MNSGTSSRPGPVRVGPETPASDREDRHHSGRPACPVCGGSLIEQRGKQICSRCRTICATCCEGGPG